MGQEDPAVSVSATVTVSVCVYGTVLVWLGAMGCPAVAVLGLQWVSGCGGAG